MPRSKRVRQAPLTKTSKRATRDHKSQLIQTVRASLDHCHAAYVLAFPNMRSSGFQQIRSDLCRRNHNDSEEEASVTKIFLGKLSLLQLALGRTIEDEYHDNLHHLSKLLKGESGLLLTTMPHSDVCQYFETFKQLDFARAGTKASRDVRVTNSDLIGFPSTMLEPLRKLGAPVDLNVGTIVLRTTGGGDNEEEKGSWRLCREGQTLSPEQCKLLQQLGVKLAEFRVTIQASWRDGEFVPHP